MRKTISSLLLLLVVAGILFILFYKNNKPSVELVTPDTYQAENTKCRSSEKYFVIERPRLTEAGMDIVVKYKQVGQPEIPCEYSVADGDFVLKDLQGPSYVMALTRKYLVIDSGTGVNGRGVTLYDLDTRIDVFHDIYSSGDPIITEASISYWKNTNELVTSKNCIQPADRLVDNNTIVTHIILDLKTLQKKGVGEKRCVYQE